MMLAFPSPPILLSNPLPPVFVVCFNCSLTPTPPIPIAPNIFKGFLISLSKLPGAFFNILANCAFNNTMKFLILFFMKFDSILNGAFINVPTTNLSASAPIAFKLFKAAITAIVITVKVVPTISKSLIILTFNLLRASTLPSDFNFKNCNVCSTNQPPARISKKFVSLLRIPCAKV